MADPAVLAPHFQAQGKVQGDWFEDTAVRILRHAGFAIDDRTGRRVAFADAGVEVDIIATNQQDVSFYCTCKGSYSGDRPGCERTDTLKKAMGEALALHEQGWGPVLLLTSHLPTTRSGLALLRSIPPDILFDALEPTSREGIKRLNWLARAAEEQLRADLAARRLEYTARLRYGRSPLP